MVLGEPRVLLDGIVYGEGPRWRDGRLWFSDILAHRVMTVDLEGRTEVVAELDDRPSGIGFLPDGTPLVTSMQKSRLMRLDPDGPKVVAELKHLGSLSINDMVVDSHGRAYIGSRIEASPGVAAEFGAVIMVTPDGESRIVAEGFRLANGTVITPDERTMIIADTFANRLMAFDIKSDGSLTNRRVHAELERDTPDGICLDADGGVWCGSPDVGDAIRVLPGGEITHRIIFEGRICVACMLGGPDRRTLFMVNARTTLDGIVKAFSGDRSALEGMSGLIETVQVDVPGVGWP